MAFLNRGPGSEEGLPPLKGEGRACAECVQRPWGDNRRGTGSGSGPVPLEYRA